MSDIDLFKIIGGHHDGQTVLLDANTKSIKLPIKAEITSMFSNVTQEFTSPAFYERQEFHCSDVSVKNRIVLFVPEGQSHFETMKKLIERY